MKQIKVALTLAGLTAAAFSLAACMGPIVASPTLGTTFNETKYGNIATEESAANKEGESLRFNDFGVGCHG